MTCLEKLGWNSVCRLLAAAALGLMIPNWCHAQSILFSENFEGVPLGQNVEEGLLDDDPRDAVWNAEGPPGWTVDRSGVPAGGVTEWRGWNFVDPIWWAEVAGQERDFFIDETELVIAVADGDEWDDKGHDPGLMNTFLTSPPISLTGVANPTLAFLSSWRPDGTQIGTVTAAYDGAAPVEILRYESDANSPNYWPDANPENVSIPLNPPAGAQNVVFTFGYTEAGNNWWWAIDNIELGPYREDFEGVELGPNVDEARAVHVDNVWSKAGPDGWSVVDMVPGLGEGSDVDGVVEWAGWSFANKDWWTGAAGDQRRSEFTKGEGTVMVADPDEWDDADHFDSAAEGWYNTFMSTPPISLDGVDASSVVLKFDSSWRDEFDDNYHQTANITVSFDGGDPIEIALWESDPDSEFFKDDIDPEESTNETVVLPIDNPAGASSMVLTFGLFDAGNDWWWAIDNIEITGLGGGLTGDYNGNGELDAGDLDLMADGMIANDAAFDLDGDGDADIDDRSVWVNDLKNTWFGDANLDGEFNSTDFVQVFQQNKFETGQPATWSQGDWNGDKQFNSSDFVVAFQGQGFEQGPKAGVSAVPEPGSFVLLSLGLVFVGRRRRR